VCTGCAEDGGHARPLSDPRRLTKPVRPDHLLQGINERLIDRFGGQLDPVSGIGIA
jgi:hypothetical protein